MYTAAKMQVIQFFMGLQCADIKYVTKIKFSTLLS
jgi:hypothetical protein